MKLHRDFLTQSNEGDDQMQMGPMIDIVFLLLIYFMVTTTLLKTEADLGLRLPGEVRQTQEIKMPDEQIIEITADNRVILNGMEFAVSGDGAIPDLVGTLRRFEAAASSAGVRAMVTIAADPESVHQRSMDVLNACAEARIRNVSFAPREGGV
jgi:biopolymer transport protein ExbD